LTIGNEVTQPIRCSVSELSLAFAERAGFRRIKSDKTICLPVGANRIAIND
jgi:hypothetical protein